MHIYFCTKLKFKTFFKWQWQFLKKSQACVQILVSLHLQPFLVPSLTNTSVINKVVQDAEMYRTIRQTYQHKCHQHQAYIREGREWTGSLLGSSGRGLDQSLLPQEDHWEWTVQNIPAICQGRTLQDRKTRGRSVGCCGHKIGSRVHGGCRGIHRSDLRTACHPDMDLAVSDIHQRLKVYVRNGVNSCIWNTSSWWTY